MKLKLAADADFLPSTWSPPVAQTQQLARSSLGREVSNSDAGQDVTGTRRVTESSWPDFFFFFYFSLLILLFVVFFFSTAYRPHCETRGGDSKLALDAARKVPGTSSFGFLPLAVCLLSVTAVLLLFALLFLRFGCSIAVAPPGGLSIVRRWLMTL